MLRGITVRQFVEWRAYADLEPFDEERADARAGMIVRELKLLRGVKRVDMKDCVVKYADRPAPAQVRARPEKQVTPDARARAVQQVSSVMEMLKAVHNKPQPQKGRR